MESGHHIVPTVVEYMEPFKRSPPLRLWASAQEVKDAEAKKWPRPLQGRQEGQQLATGAADILHTLGDAAVQWLWAAPPTRPHLPRAAKGKIKKVRAELFARRSINCDGARRTEPCPTADYQMYNKLRSGLPGRGGGDRGGHRARHPAHHHHHRRDACTAGTP